MRDQKIHNEYRNIAYDSTRSHGDCSHVHELKKKPYHEQVTGRNILIIDNVTSKI